MARASQCAQFLLAACLLILPALGAPGCASQSRSLAPATGDDQLRIARMRYERREYTDAIELLKGQIQYQPGAANLDEAHQLLGLCYVGRAEWPLATTEFLIVTSDFPDSKFLPEAHYWLGYSYWKQSRAAPYDQDFTRRSLAQWERYLNLYPEHERVPDATRFRAEGRNRLAEKAVRNGELYLKLKQWNPARIYFEQVESDYADTSWLDRARVGRATALNELGRYSEAKDLLEKSLPVMQDERQKRRARELLQKLEEKASQQTHGTTE